MRNFVGGRGVVGGDEDAVGAAESSVSEAVLHKDHGVYVPWAPTGRWETRRGDPCEFRQRRGMQRLWRSFQCGVNICNTLPSIGFLSLETTTYKRCPDTKIKEE